MFFNKVVNHSDNQPNRCYQGDFFPMYFILISDSCCVIKDSEAPLGIVKYKNSNFSKVFMTLNTMGKIYVAPSEKF